MEIRDFWGSFSTINCNDFCMLYNVYSSFPCISSPYIDSCTWCICLLMSCFWLYTILTYNLHGVICNLCHNLHFPIVYFVMGNCLFSHSFHGTNTIVEQHDPTCMTTTTCEFLLKFLSWCKLLARMTDFANTQRLIA